MTTKRNDYIITLTKRNEVIKIDERSEMIGNRLKDLRIKKNKTQRDIAHIFGITEGAIGMYEQGRRIPNDIIKKKYSLYFDKSVDEIFFK